MFSNERTGEAPMPQSMREMIIILSVGGWAWALWVGLFLLYRLRRP